ncbi:LuxR C-terminal-related transcriptional regulator [Myceligenerans indicum]|uniref:AAA family ATPase n=1 Tax=Myceligenerans indicum TaxID=2593663 RepID=A0ABS1LF73_9MICO|nr:LuxR C-terminal-related transcriptional regulator [Myceligenerans indicum]MBL0884906.1 AAA family ATPase [Myceligenerans indicum]
MVFPGTRLSIPAPRRALVSRPRLTERLDSVHDAMPRLLLVVAPAGFGKTTLLTQWLTKARTAGAEPRRVAWLSIAAGDDLDRFLTGLVMAVARADHDGLMAAEAAGALESGAGIASDAVIAGLIDELDSADGTTVIALDDYHLVTSQAVHDAVDLLTANLPPHVMVAMTTRVDPPLRLPRLRARGELLEIRAADLQFTLGEARAFLNEAMGLDLADAELRALESRTEGWAAGLQLAGLSVRGRSPSEVADFVDAFAGSHGYVLDYLLEEVLDSQPAEVREFLLTTSLLGELTGSLCDAVTGRKDGRRMLERLERSGLFVTGLDDSRQWFRYHQLFADALRAQLALRQPEHEPGLHRAAARWYAAHEMLPEAIGHALDAGSSTDAAELLELALPRLKRSRQDLIVRAALDRLPDDLIRGHPLLAAFAGWARLSIGDLAGARPWLHGTGVEHRRAGTPVAGLGAAVPDAFHRELDGELDELPATVESYRAVLAQASGDVVGTVKHARRSLEFAPTDDHYTRGAAGGLLALAQWASGDIDEAITSFSAAIGNLRAGGTLASALGSTVVIGSMQLAAGRTGQARRAYERALEEAEKSPAAASVVGDLHVGLAEVLVEQGDVAGATAHLDTAAGLGAGAGLPENDFRRHVVLARLALARGETGQAVDALDAATSAFLPGFLPEVQPLPAVRARVLIAAGRLDEASEWARQKSIAGPPADGLPDYASEYDMLTWARLEIRERHSGDHALTALAAWLAAAAEQLDGTSRGRGRIDAAIAAALAEDARGARESAVDRLEPAVLWSASGGSARAFLDDGPPMQALLAAVAERGGPAGKRAREILALHAVARQGSALPPRSPGRTPQGPIEPLSEREREVLRLLDSELSGPEISKELYVSINTFRTHTKSTFLKLGVTTRRAAVARARELGLL